MTTDMLRLIAARAIALVGVLIIFFMDHQLFFPFGLFVAVGLFFVSAYIYRDFTDPKPLTEKQSYWGVVTAMIFGGFSTEVLRSLNIDLPTKTRILLFCALVLVTVLYTLMDAKSKIKKLEAKRLANKAL